MQPFPCGYLDFCIKIRLQAKSFVLKIRLQHRKTSKFTMLEHKFTKAALMLCCFYSTNQ